MLSDFSFNLVFEVEDVSVDLAFNDFCELVPLLFVVGVLGG
jgi:hypothetical protein